MNKVHDFVEWVQSKLEELNWSQAELARRGGITPSAISKLMTRQQREPGKEMLAAIAKAFQMPLEEVLRIAGELPEVPKDLEYLERINQELAQLDDEDKEEILDIIKAKVRRKQARHISGRASNDGLLPR